ncbi:cobalamin B12-binding domain-containing protein [Blastococcus sp. CT_GayMR20]|uniref:cobalamin B12-binding domain-containing protein n=1 Tax=Blastococcus sp. CT_GayMR20 TaxID=2559609 RepID=UPI001072FDAD|nr:cobalamin B12-binding domain-containing protein [Blastococcus sp. CT_GayMR20]TFV90253.1 cobalamin B12-binding domain-containing protein [Blastococcus sp. CT_GayMR20]
MTTFRDSDLDRPGEAPGSAGRVLVAKIGLDGHDVGAKYVARLLRDSGFEVVYLGIRQRVEAVVRAAIDENVDIVGLSILSGSHVALVERVCALLAEEDDDPPPVVVGGVIPPEDHQALKELGVRAIFNAGTSPEQMVDVMRRLVIDPDAVAAGEP